MTDILKQIPVLAANVVFRKVGDGGILLNTKSGQIYSCNTTSQSFLAAVDGQTSAGAIVIRMLDEYDVGETELKADIGELLSRLEAEAVIEMRPVAG
ncbi:MAG: PqqD family protein [Rhizobiaceae bacterium]